MLFRNPIITLAGFAVRNIVKRRAFAPELLLIFSTIYGHLPALIKTYGYRDLIKTLTAIYRHVQPMAYKFLSTGVLKASETAIILRDLRNLMNPTFIANNPAFRALSPLLVTSVVDAIIPKIEKMVTESKSVSNVLYFLKIFKFTTIIVSISAMGRGIYNASKLIIASTAGSLGIVNTDILPDGNMVKEMCSSFLSFFGIDLNYFNPDDSVDTPTPEKVEEPTPVINSQPVYYPSPISTLQLETPVKPTNIGFYNYLNLSKDTALSAFNICMPLATNYFNNCVYFSSIVLSPGLTVLSYTWSYGIYVYAILASCTVYDMFYIIKDLNPVEAQQRYLDLVEPAYVAIDLIIRTIIGKFF